MGSRYYVVKEQAVPEVLLKVVQAKKLIDSGKAVSVNEAAEAVGIRGVPFISTRRIFSNSMIMRRERRLR